MLRADERDDGVAPDSTACGCGIVGVLPVVLAGVSPCLSFSRSFRRNFRRSPKVPVTTTCDATFGVLCRVERCSRTSRSDSSRRAGFSRSRPFSRPDPEARSLSLSLSRSRCRYSLEVEAGGCRNSRSEEYSTSYACVLRGSSCSSKSRSRCRSPSSRRCCLLLRAFRFSSRSVLESRSMSLSRRT